jgi:glycosyltransferase involved in cell wall biosynthesis
MKLSAIILTYNEENNIEQCLKSFPPGVEIIIIDSGSTDKIIEIAQKYGAKIFISKLELFGPQRNFGLEKATNNWIIFLDADEELSNELKEKLPSLIDNRKNIIGFDIRRDNYMIGKKLNYCWNSDYVLRLFNKSFARDEGGIHARAIATGKIARIEEPILHFTFQSISRYFNKVNHYSSAEAERLYRERTPPKGMISRSWAMFTQMLFGKKGLLDGKRGIILAFMEGIQSFLTYAKLWELYENEKNK